MKDIHDEIDSLDNTALLFRFLVTREMRDDSQELYLAEIKKRNLTHIALYT